MNRPHECSRPTCTRRAGAKGLCDPHYRNEYGHLSGLQDASEAIAHLARLRAKGMGWRYISELTGMSDEGLQKLGSWTNGWATVESVHRIMAIPVPVRIVDGGGLIPSVGTARRIRALSAFGYTFAKIGAEAGLPHRSVGFVLGRSLVTSSTAVAIQDAFDRLHMVWGGSELAARRARAKGWALPLSWDEDTIDDPRSRPILKPDVRFDKAEMLEDRRIRVRMLTSQGLSADEIAARLDIDARTVQRDRAELRREWGVAS